jgi:hypothetical protein
MNARMDVSKQFRQIADSIKRSARSFCSGRSIKAFAVTSYARLAIKEFGIKAE